MRAKSKRGASGQLFAVAGVNTISFGIVPSAAVKAGLLGFTVTRAELPGGKPRVVPGFKDFRSLIPDPNEETQVRTKDHPVRSFS